MSQADERTFDELASIVAHELIAPLTVIGSAASLLRRDPERDDDPEEVAEIVATIHRNVELAKLVVEGLRSSDIADDEVPIDPEPTDLVALARTVVGDLERTVLRNHPAEVYGEDELVAPVDPIRVRQVLFNLLSNAAKYSPAGRDVRVGVEAVDGVARITVRDRGHGVAPEDADRIFSKWTRAHHDTDGLGLGLHLARAIARSHDGDIRMEHPEDGQGSIFVMELPR